MAEVISYKDVLRARRRARQQRETEACVRIIEANLRLALELFSSGPDVERPVRARQIRQLSELLEYVTIAAQR
jgi:hypothetical protein